MKVNKIYDTSGLLAGEERFEELLSVGGMRLERIVSFGCATAEGEWYDQDSDEWVLLVCGRAELEFGDGTLLPMIGGDYLVISAHNRHRVRSVSDDAIWLGLFY